MLTLTTVKLPGKSDSVALNSISHLQADGQYTWVVFEQTPRYLVSLNINRVLPTDTPGFIRLSVGLIVRLSAIASLRVDLESYKCGRSYEKLTLTLQNGQTLTATSRITEDCLNALFSLAIPVTFHVKHSLTVNVKRLATLLSRLNQTHNAEFTIKNNAIKDLTFYPYDYKINGPATGQSKRKPRNRNGKRPAKAKPTA